MHRYRFKIASTLNTIIEQYLCPHDSPKYNLSSSVMPVVTFPLYVEDLPESKYRLEIRGFMSIPPLSTSLVTQLGHLMAEVHVPNSLGSTQRGQEQSKYHCSRSLICLSNRPIREFIVITKSLGYRMKHILYLVVIT